MGDFLKLLEGKKTYISSALAGIVIALHLSGVLTLEQANMALAALGFAGIAALRAAK